MTNFSGTEIWVRCTVDIEMDVDFYGDVEGAVKRCGGDIYLVVCRAFIELANLGNSFNIMYHNFSIEFENEVLSFSVASIAYVPGPMLRIAISLVDGPIKIDTSKLSAAALHALSHLTDFDETEH